MLKPKKAAKLDLADYFNNPVSPRQKQYEAIRAIVVENASVDTVAKKYGYQSSTIYSLLREAKAGRLSLFPAIAKGPKKKQTSPAVQNRIIALRKQALSTPDIHQRLLEEGIKSSISTVVERILKAAGFDKLPRRTNQALGKSTTTRCSS